MASSIPSRPSAFSWELAHLQHRDCLPHLRQANVIYFVTFRLHDSLPTSHFNKIRAARDGWLHVNPPPHTAKQSAQLRALWTVPIERLLDASHGTCPLRDAMCRQPLESTMRHDDTKTYRLGNFVIMPNHVHALIHVPNDHDLSTILQAWKSISARTINRLLHRRGTFWQPEPFDHIVRDEHHWLRFIKYIQKNPARLPSDTFTLGCGSLGFPTS